MPLSVILALLLSILLFQSFQSKGAGTPGYYPLYTALTTFYSDYFVGSLWAHLTTIYKRIFLYFAYLQG